MLCAGLSAVVLCQALRVQPGSNVQVMLSVPATDELAPTKETFVAVGLGLLVTEDWSSQGSVHLFKVVSEKTQTFDGQLTDRWSLVDTHRREFSGPVAALSMASNNLVVAHGHTVRFCFPGAFRTCEHGLSGYGLERCPPRFAVADIDAVSALSHTMRSHSSGCACAVRFAARLYRILP